jgi:hypothetical protein
MSSDANPRTLVEGFSQARLAAETHMRKFETLGLLWHEETITDLMTGAATPFVKVAPFNKTEEGQTGGDWLWWRVDGTGESFGMLVQAKSLKNAKGKWSIDSEYGKDEKGEQRCLARSVRATSGGRRRC